jgi:hypothetical protein
MRRCLSCSFSESLVERTPFLVQRKQVRAALEWLKLNHADYHDIEIPLKNLESYPENGPPVVIEYHKSNSNKNTGRYQCL